MSNWQIDTPPQATSVSNLILFAYLLPSSTVQVDDDSYTWEELPVRTHEEFELLESKLKQDNYYKLALVGGMDHLCCASWHWWVAWIICVVQAGTGGWHGSFVLYKLALVGGMDHLCCTSWHCWVAWMISVVQLLALLGSMDAACYTAAGGSIFTLFCLPSFSVSLSLIFFAVSMRKCWGSTFSLEDVLWL